MALNAYIDDSGSEGQGETFVLAGYVASVENWKRFSEDWQKILDSDPPLEYFKLKEAIRLEDQFRGWSTKDRDKRLGQFSTIVKKWASRGILSVMPYAPYRAVFQGNLPQDIDHPYFFCFYSIVNYLIGYQRKVNVSEKVDFIFDEQGPLGDLVASLYDHVIEVSPPSARSIFGGRPIFRNDRDFLPLQAADAFAWLNRRFFYDELMHPNIPRDLVLDFASLPAIGRIWSVPSLVRLRKAMHIILSDLPKWKELATTREHLPLYEILSHLENPNTAADESRTVENTP